MRQGSISVVAGGDEQRRSDGRASTSVEIVGPVQPAHVEQRRVLAIDCLGVAASECEIYFDFRPRRRLLEVFAAMAQAPLLGVPPDDDIVDRKEESGATLSPGVTAAAVAACTLQALAPPVAGAACSCTLHGDACTLHGDACTLQALGRPVKEKKQSIEQAERVHRVRWRRLL